MIKLVRDVFSREPKLKPFAVGLAIFAITAAGVGLVALGTPAQGSSSLDNFWISLSASFVEDFVFFVFIGAIGIYISLVKPGDEVLDSRIRYLFNASVVSEPLRRHLSARIRPLGLFSNHYVTTIEFEEYSATLKAVKAHVTVERRLANMFRDIQFENEPQRICILTDEVGQPGMCRGQLISCSVKTNGIVERLVGSPVDITTEKLEREFRISVPRDGAVEFQYSFWVWHAVGQGYSLEVLRYSEGVQVVVKNAMPLAVSLCDTETGRLHSLTEGTSCHYNWPELAAGGKRPFTLEKCDVQA